MRLFNIRNENILIAILSISSVVLVIWLMFFEQDKYTNNKTESFPQKTITIVVPYGAGGSTDNFVRALLNPLKEAFNANVVVRNIAGGGGAVGTMIALAHKPDGYTVTVTSNAIYTLQGMGNVSFKTSDFDFIARVATEPYVLAIKAKPEWHNLSAFIESAHQQQVTLGYAGVGSSTHIMAEAISQGLGIKVKLIPFSGGSAAVAATLGDHIDGVVLTPAGVASGLESGKLVAIGATGASKQLPNVTIFSEQGYDIATLQWRGIAAPKGLAADVKAKWINAIKQAVEDQNFINAVTNLGVDVNPAYASILDDFVKKESDLMITLTKTSVVK